MARDLHIPGGGVVFDDGSGDLHIPGSGVVFLPEAIVDIVPDAFSIDVTLGSASLAIEATVGARDILIPGGGSFYAYGGESKDVHVPGSGVVFVEELSEAQQIDPDTLQVEPTFGSPTIQAAAVVPSDLLVEVQFGSASVSLSSGDVTPGALSVDVEIPGPQMVQPLTQLDVTGLPGPHVVIPVKIPELAVLGLQVDILFGSPAVPTGAIAVSASHWLINVSLGQPGVTQTNLQLFPGALLVEPLIGSPGIQQLPPISPAALEIGVLFGNPPVLNFPPQLYPHRRIHSARFGAFRFGFARFGFTPDDVEMDGADAFYGYEIDEKRNEGQWNAEEDDWTVKRPVTGGEE